MRRRGFTLIELAIVLVIGTLLVPIAWTWFTRQEDQARLTRWELEIAQALPTLSEELREDAWRGVAVGGEEITFRRADCTVQYRVEARALVRVAEASCGGTRALATHVESLRPIAGGVEVVFSRTLRPERAGRRTGFLPWGSP